MVIATFRSALDLPIADKATVGLSGRFPLLGVCVDRAPPLRHLDRVKQGFIETNGVGEKNRKSLSSFQIVARTVAWSFTQRFFLFPVIFPVSRESVVGEGLKERGLKAGANESRGGRWNQIGCTVTSLHLPNIFSVSRQI
jgi:hypothetical protein